MFTEYILSPFTLHFFFTAGRHTSHSPITTLWPQFIPNHEQPSPDPERRSLTSGLKVGPWNQGSRNSRQVRLWIIYKELGIVYFDMCRDSDSRSGVVRANGKCNFTTSPLLFLYIMRDLMKTNDSWAALPHLRYKLMVAEHYKIQTSTFPILSFPK